MATRVAARKGYPWTLDVEVRYELTTVGADRDDLGDATSSASARPARHRPSPLPLAGYGTGRRRDVRFAADTRIETDAERQLPTDTRTAVAGTVVRLRRPDA